MNIHQQIQFLALPLFALTLNACSSTPAKTDRIPAYSPKRALVVHSHRGANYLPENMMTAFMCAAKQGADYVEMDLQITKDDQIIVAHDAYVKDECTDDKGVRVAAKAVFYRTMKWQDIEKLDCGTNTHGHIQPVPGERISKLEDVLSAMKDVRNASNAPIAFNIEIKFNPTQKNYYPSRRHYARKVFDVIKNSGIEENRLLVQSFDVDILVEMRKLHPTIRLSQLIGDSHAMESAMENLELLNTDLITPHYGLVTKEIVDAFHARNARVIPWTVNSEDVKAQMEAAGVDGIITDNLNLTHPETAQIACP